MEATLYERIFLAPAPKYFEDRCLGNEGPDGPGDKESGDQTSQDVGRKVFDKGLDSGMEQYRYHYSLILVHHADLDYTYIVRINWTFSLKYFLRR